VVFVVFFAVGIDEHRSFAIFRRQFDLDICSITFVLVLVWDVNSGSAASANSANGAANGA